MGVNVTVGIEYLRECVGSVEGLGFIKAFIGQEQFVLLIVMEGHPLQPRGCMLLQGNSGLLW